jgi:kinesin family member 15
MKACTPVRASVGGGEPERESGAETTCIKVLVRVRPPLQCEPGEDEGSSTLARGAPRAGPDASCVSVGADGQVLVTLPRTLRGRGEDASLLFRFDHVAPHDASQADIFENVGLEAAHAFLDGFNAAIFAYGQTGSGKTYTMYGDVEGTRLQKYSLL